MNMTWYSIDYSELSIFLNSLDLFNNKNLQNKYLNYCLSEIKKQDGMLLDEFKGARNFSNYEKEKEGRNCFFQQPISLNNVNLFLHLRIGKMKTIVDNEIKNNANVPLEKIRMSDFIGKSKKFIWKEVPINIKHEVDYSPIYFISFSMGNIPFLIIDGNHRISHHLKLGKPFIKAIGIRQEFIIEQNLTVSSFDEAIFKLYLDIQRIGFLKMTSSRKDSELLKESLFLDL